MCKKTLGGWRKALLCVLVAILTLLALVCASASDVGIHSSGRYYQDSSGKPMFLIGYYAWAPMATGDTSGNGGAQYLNMIANF